MSEYNFRQIPSIVYIMFSVLGYSIAQILISNARLEVKIFAVILGISFSLLTAYFEVSMQDRDIQRWKLEA